MDRIIEGEIDKIVAIMTNKERIAALEAELAQARKENAGLEERYVRFKPRIKALEEVHEAVKAREVLLEELFASNTNLAADWVARHTGSENRIRAAVAAVRESEIGGAI